MLPNGVLSDITYPCEPPLPLKVEGKSKTNAMRFSHAFLLVSSLTGRGAQGLQQIASSFLRSHPSIFRGRGEGWAKPRTTRGLDDRPQHLEDICEHLRIPRTRKEHIVSISIQPRQVNLRRGLAIEG